MASKERPKDMAEALRRAITRLPGQVRHRAANALHGFDQAYILFPIDREMASFRAITAVEESASALFMALRVRNYPGAEKLNTGNHRHKAAVAPFLQAMENALAAGPFKTVSFDLNWNKPSITLHLPLSEIGVEIPGVPGARLTTEEPLHFLHSSGTGDKPTPYLFKEEMARLTSASTYASIEKMISAQANARNTLLYASDAGTPKSQATVESLKARQRTGELMLFLAIAILQTRTRQHLAVQGLQAFLGIVAPNEQIAVEYEALPDPDVTFVVKDDDTVQVTIGQAAD